MSSNWLKIRENIHEDPAILRMAHKLNTRPEHVVGYCVKFWGWVSRNVVPNVSLEDGDTCPDLVPDVSSGIVPDVPIESLEAVLNVPGFLALLQEVGWLKCHEVDGKSLIVIPKMDRHLSESAKKRALDAEKKRKLRALKKTSPSASPARPKSVPQKRGPDKRREDNKEGAPAPGGRKVSATTLRSLERRKRIAAELAAEAAETAEAVQE